MMVESSHGSLFCLLSLCLLLACGPAGGQPNPDPVTTMRVAGADLTVRTRGQGATVVFVHGQGEDYRAWEAQEAALLSHYRVVSYSRRYHYPNRWENGPPYTYDLHAGDLEQIIRKLGGGPVYLVGHSYGAYVALQVALHHPELVRALVLAEPPLPSLMDTSKQYDPVRESRKAALDSIGVALAQGDSVAAARLLVDWTNDAPGTFASLDEDHRVQALANARALALPLAAPTPPPLGCDEVGRLTLPVLVLEGESTNPFYRLSGDGLARCLPGLTRVVIPDAGHHMIWQNPAEVNRVLGAFLERN